MSPAQIIRQAVADQSVVLIEGEHDGIGDAAIDALNDAGWEVVKLTVATPADLEAGPGYGQNFYRVTEWAR